MKIVVLPGDGIGPETMAATLDVLEAASKRFDLGLTFDHDVAGHESLRRHGATVTVLAGIVLYGYLYAKGGTGAIALGIGGLLGIIMMGNVHGVIWPNQKKVIAAVAAAAQGTPAPPEMAQWGKTALYASRINFLLSIPMLFFMGAGSHLK